MPKADAVDVVMWRLREVTGKRFRRGEVRLLYGSAIMHDIARPNEEYIYLPGGDVVCAIPAKKESSQ